MKKSIGILLLLFATSLIAQHKTVSPLKSIDTVSFQKETLPSSKQITYHSTTYELQKFYAFKIKASKIKDRKKYLSEIHSFTKDSLQILSVKLISIKELNDKKLLDKDIAQNKDFYIAILNDLRESEINPTEYLFLENKLSKILINVVETKYAYSKSLNIILSIVILTLLIVLVLKTRQKKATVSSLSKQETAISNLILEGKSNKEIANELFISLSTVKTHITNIYHKLDVSNRNELVLKFKN